MPEDGSEVPATGVTENRLSSPAAQPMSYRSLIRWSAGVVATAPGPFAASVLATLAATLLTQYSTLVVGDILDGVSKGTDPSLGRRAILYAVLVLALIVTRFGGRVLVGWSETRMIAQLQQTLHDKLLRLGASFHERHEFGEASAIVLQFSGGAAEMLRDFAAFPVLRGIPLVTAMWGLMLSLGKLHAMPVEAQIGIAVVLLALPVIGSRMARRVQVAAGALQHAQVELATEFANSASQPMEVRVLGAERQRAAAFAGRLSTMASAKFSAMARLTTADELQSAMPLLLQATFLIYAVFVLVTAKSLSVGSVLVIYAFVPQVIAPMQDLIAFNIGLHFSWPIVAQVGELLDAAPPVDVAGTALPEGHSVVLDDVTLRYTDRGRLVLDGLSHGFLPGRISAIVGRSGSGKSSILQLLNVMRQPTQGTVNLGGVATTSIDPEVLRRHVVTVSQFPLFVTDTVRVNFQLADENATDAEIEAICRQTGLWPVLTAASPSHPLDVVLSRTAGQSLSGGERRLFAITRALLRRPQVLLLDEPTTGIDHLSVQALAGRLPDLLTGLTVIIVDHDISFVEQIAAQVCCLEGGRFVEIGTPAELAARPSLFRRLAAAQQTMSTSNMTIESIPLPSLRGSNTPRPDAVQQEG
jgi:ABC-type multidrug transport system fused ATPase/permease subunit